MSRLRGRASLKLASVTVVLLGLAPGLAQACAVCSAGRNEENQLAFIITTAFMSVLPLLLIGGLIFWLRGRFRALDEERSALPAGGVAAREV